MRSIFQFVESKLIVCWRTTALGHVELTSTVGLRGISPCGINFSPLMFCRIKTVEAKVEHVF